MINQTFFLLTSLFLISSCNEVSKSEPRHKNDDAFHIDSVISRILFQKAINQGDFNAYNKIANNYLLKDKYADIYYYSLIMANKYQCPEAYYHLFVIMNDRATLNGINLFSEDYSTKSMSLFYLLKSKELGFEKAQFDIDEIFGRNKKLPKSNVYLLESLKN